MSSLSLPTLSYYHSSLSFINCHRILSTAVHKGVAICEAAPGSLLLSCPLNRSLLSHSESTIHNSKAFIVGVWGIPILSPDFAQVPDHVVREERRGTFEEEEVTTL